MLVLDTFWGEKDTQKIQKDTEKIPKRYKKDTKKQKKDTAAWGYPFFEFSLFCPRRKDRVR